MIGPTYVRARDPLGLLDLGGDGARRGPSCATYPREDVLRRVIQPADTQVFTGNEVARTKGEGIEFADIRPWGAGRPAEARQLAGERAARRPLGEREPSRAEHRRDPLRRLVRRGAARRRGNARPRRARDVRRSPTRTSRRRDRVGLIAFGGILRWLVPGTGLVQLYRIVDALLDTQIVLSYYWKEIDVIPRRTLPPNALVIALSPLLDPRSVGALLDLRARGYDLAVIDVSPVPFTDAAGERPRRGRLRHLDASPRRAPPPAAAAPASRSSSGTTSCRCRPSWRRCGHSGATPGTRAADHRARRVARTGRHVRLRSRDRRPVRADRDRRRRARPSGCSRSGSCCAGRA